MSVNARKMTSSLTARSKTRRDALETSWNFSSWDTVRDVYARKLINASRFAQGRNAILNVTPWRRSRLRPS